ncbi:hypothetical protein EW146_g6166 [Bondarzewia mesenterica]|uniref:Serine aminopeptidase S33 domain-containing protein n=1 Tax=Bondarzewia mesenterica TaxID=1095465 RepID=A0A4S4LQD6_9AGAM|nr:hypothetical protein EW146_g6166 [Bondarzewia mesenterica]
MATLSYVETWITGPLSTSFYTRLYTPPSAPPRGAIVFVHGYIEHIGRYEQVHGDWAARGFAVFAYDQRGFGRTALDAEKSVASVYGQTGGTPERMMDVEWAVKYASRKFEGVPLFLMGHSMVCPVHLLHGSGAEIWIASGLSTQGRRHYSGLRNSYRSSTRQGNRIASVWHNRFEPICTHL